jgi:hypothetical protein
LFAINEHQDKVGMQKKVYCIGHCCLSLLILAMLFALLQFYDPSSHLAAVHYPADPTLYSHAYPPEPGFSGTATQLPPDNIVRPSFGSAPPHHLEPPPPGTPVVAPTPAPAPVYNVLPPGVPPMPVGFTGQPAPFSFSSEIPSPENALNRALHGIEKPQDPPEVPPPPKISQVIKVS